MLIVQWKPLCVTFIYTKVYKNMDPCLRTGVFSFRDLCTSYRWYLYILPLFFFFVCVWYRY